MVCEQEAHEAVRPWAQCIVSLDAETRADGWSPADTERLWHTHDLMQSLFSGRYRGSGRPFINHLAGTASLALRYRGTTDEVLAGYSHAAYTQGRFGRPHAQRAENRAALAGVVGAVAERLAAQYDAVDWEEFAGRAGPGEIDGLSHEGKQVLFLQIVNEFDDAFDWFVYADGWRAGCIQRLQAGAEFAHTLGHHELAADLGRVYPVLDMEQGQRGPITRPKYSHTVPNIAAAAPHRPIRAVLGRVRRRLRASR